MDLYCFSPCGSTEMCAQEVLKGMGESPELIDLTLAKQQARSASDTVVFAFPVYAGHVPPLVFERLESALEGDCAGKQAIVIATYGNRNYDNALKEADEFLSEKGFTCIAFVAAIGQHTLCSAIATGRPDASDCTMLNGFGADIKAKLPKGGAASGYETVDDLNPYHPNPAPITTEACTACGICAAACPSQVIEIEDAAVSPQTCLGCARCIKECPEGARKFPDEVSQMFAGFLAKVASERREPQLFI